MKYLIEDTTLTGIADAVRGKNGTTEPIMVSELATAITNLPSGGGGDIEVEPIELTGDCSRACQGLMASNYISLFGNTISTKDITNANYMFYSYSGETIPFEINFKSGTAVDVGDMYTYSTKITEVPKMNNLKVKSASGLFEYCERLREIPADLDETWDWSAVDNSTSAYGGAMDSIFNGCYSLRVAPIFLLKHGNPNNIATYYSIYSGTFGNCAALDEVINLPFPHTKATWTSNAFNSTVSNCYRLKRFTFALKEDGSPYVVNWGKQTLDFSQWVGYAGYSSIYIYSRNSGITRDKEVKDDATYQALKNDPDWFTEKVEYSRYNHDSAVETINSLPDCSATGTNTIKFKGQSGSLTDGGAINTLTEEEIAIAAAKGWTVSLV